MKINYINIIDGIHSKYFSFDSNSTLIHSKKNSKGKTTLVRLILFSIGYPIPSTKGMNFNKIILKTCIEVNKSEIYITRNANCLSVQEEGKDLIDYTLPFDHITFLCRIFEIDNLKVLRNIIGAIYIDQEKGWSLLNRGKVISKIDFSIEELVAGLNDIDCDQLLNEKKQLKNNIAKYNKLLEISDLQNKILESSGEIVNNNFETELHNEELLLKLQLQRIKNELTSINELLITDEHFIQFIESMGLKVHYDEIDIPVTKDTIVNYSSQHEYFQTRKSILLVEQETTKKKLHDTQHKLSKYTTSQLSLFGTQETKELTVDRSIMKLHINPIEIKDLIDVTKKRKAFVEEQLKQVIKSNNPYINKIFQYVNIYAKELKIQDDIQDDEIFIFTDDLKGFSGAILQKLVFSFKMAFIKVIEEKINCSLPIILDSPKGKELDDDNYQLIISLIQNHFSNNQIIIATIADYPANKIIELKSQLMENADIFK